MARLFIGGGSDRRFYGDTVANLGAAADHNGEEWLLADPGGNGSNIAIPASVCSNGVVWRCVNGESLLAHGVVDKNVTGPAVTWTGTFTITTAGGGAHTKLDTGAGVHGLTAASNGSYVPFTGGTGWTIGLLKIISVDSTTAITFEHPYDVGLGQPTVSYAAAEVATLRLIVPALTATGGVRFNITHDATGASTSHKIRVRHTTRGGAATSGTLLIDQTTTAGEVKRTDGGFRNVNATNIQYSYMVDSDQDGFGSSTAGAVVSGAIQTNTATDILLTQLLVADQGISNKGYSFSFIL